MILGFKKSFPKGEPTNFREKIFFKTKIHSIREGQRWKAGMQIQMAYGVRTKAYNQFNINVPYLSYVKSTQRFDLIFRSPDTCMIFVDRKLKFARSTSKMPKGVHISADFAGSEKLSISFFEYGGQWFKAFIHNDGFDNEEQFWAWFKKPIRNGQIIHWTNLKY
jgi:hypothetical protein